MSISTYENTPELNFGSSPFLLKPLAAPASLSGDYSTHIAWPPVMSGTLHTTEVNDPSVVNGSLVFELKCQPTKASVTIVGNQYTLEPLIGENGPDVFTYTVRQMKYDTATGSMVLVQGTTGETNQVTLTVLPVNQPPQPTTDTQLAVVISSALQDHKLEPASGLDSDGHKVTYRIITAPKYGSFRFVAGDNATATGDSTFVYTSGVAAGTETLEYEVDDCVENSDLRPLEDQVPGADWNRLNCMKGLIRGFLTVTVTATDALPDVVAGAVTLAEDQAEHELGVLTRNPSPAPASESHLRFVMRTTPTLGTVDFQCAWEISSNVTASTPTNWTAMASGRFCENVGGSNGTNSQVYRFRPAINVNGADFFSFSLRGVGTEEGKTLPLDKTIAVTIVPTNDPPTIPNNRTVTVGYYSFRDDERAWVDPLIPNATGTMNFTAITFEATSLDGETVMLANMSNPSFGLLFTNLGSDGRDVDESSLYSAGTLLNMTLNIAAATDATTSFNLTLYYVPPDGARSMPAASISWYAWDGVMVKSIPGTALIQVLCPVGFYKKDDLHVSAASAKLTHGECAPCAAGTYSPVEDSSRCTLAAVGYYAEAGMGRHVPCPLGTYSDSTAAAKCTACPRNREGNTALTSTTPSAASPSIASCVCTAADPTASFSFGYYGRAGESCYYCDDAIGWTCTEKNLTLPLPSYGFWIDVCHPYPAKRRQCFPSHACMAISAANVSTMFQTNDNVSWTTACAKLPVPDVVDGTCLDGFEESACSTCIRPGFYRLTGSCGKCPESDNTVTIIFIAIGVIIAAPILFKASEQMNNFPSINIGISFSQYVGLFSVQLKYPEVLRRIMAAFSFFNLNLELIHPECSIGSWDSSKKWQVVSLMPFAVFTLLSTAVAGVGLVCAFNALAHAYFMRANPDFLKLGVGQTAGVGYKVKRLMVIGVSWSQFVTFAQKAIRAQLTFFQVAYLFLAASAFELFDCTKNESDGFYYLDSEPSVRCGWPYAPNDTATQNWLDVYMYAIASIVIYPIGIFVLFATLLYMIRYSRDSDATRKILGFFYFRYEKEWYWYELVQLAKKAILVAILLLLPDGNTSLQSRKACCSIALVTLVTLMHFYATPYQSANLDRMMAMALGAEFLLLFSGLIFLTDKLSVHFRLALTILNVIFIISVVCLLLIFILLDVAPGAILKLEKFFRNRKNRAERKKFRRKRTLKMAERKVSGEIGEPLVNPLSIYSQVVIFAFIKRVLVSHQAAKFFTPRAAAAVATIRTASGQQRIRELAKRSVLECHPLSRLPKLTKENIKSMFNKLQERSKKRETLSIMTKIDPNFSDFIKKIAKSDTLEGLAIGDVAENLSTDRFFEKLMCGQLSVQQKEAATASRCMRFVKAIRQGRSTWKRTRHARGKMHATEEQADGGGGGDGSGGRGDKTQGDGGHDSPDIVLFSAGSESSSEKFTETDLSPTHNTDVEQTWSDEDIDYPRSRDFSRDGDQAPPYPPHPHKPTSPRESAYKI